VATAQANQKATWPERRFLAVLGMPTLALALGVTTVSSFAPLFLVDLTGALVAGMLIASEGVFAFIVPTLVGRWSDRMPGGRLGSRLPFLLVAAPLGAAGLLLIPLAGRSVGLIALGVAMFYVAYFAYFAPYMALYPDLVPDRLRGRSQGSVGLWREAGLGLALVAGGLLLSLWRPLPFVMAAIVLLGLTALFTLRVRARATGHGGQRSARASGVATRDLLRRSAQLRAALAANALWETALNALRAFVLLFFTVGLGRSPSFASAVFAVVAVAAFVAAPVAGTLADRFGHRRVMTVALWIYGIGVLVPLFSQATWVIAVVLVVAFAAATVMTLPFGLVMGLMADDDHGAAAGLFATSRGVGLIAGPLLAGGAVALSDVLDLLPATDGYAAIFAVAGLALLASLPLLRRTRR
jgi:MFS family permease